MYLGGMIHHLQHILYPYLPKKGTLLDYPFQTKHGKTNQEKTEESVDINLPQKISDINELGYPTNDPYGLVAAFWRAFG